MGRGTTRAIRRSLRRLPLVLLLVAASGGSVVGAVGAPRPPRPPEQPAEGPGGAAFAFEGVSATRVGRPPTGYWLFEPSDLRLEEAPTGEPLPLVLFFHGFTALDPAVYRAWIDHIVRRGAIVVYPDYHDLAPFGDDVAAYQANAFAAVGDAIAELERGTRTRPDLTRVAAVGHSLGGVLAANYAALAAAERLPPADVLMAVLPGGCAGCDPIPRGEGVPLADLGAVPAGALALVVVGEDDGVVGEAAARRIWAGLGRIPLERRDYVTLVSDLRGVPILRATHWLPQTDGFRSTLDALDWYGTWKLLDLATVCAFQDEGCEVALNGSFDQRHMGLWSDGEPVEEAVVTDRPED